MKLQIIYILKSLLISLLLPPLERLVKKAASLVRRWCEQKKAVDNSELEPEAKPEDNSESKAEEKPDTESGMTIQAFVEKFTGVPISFWDNGSVQCVDVVRAFIRDVLERPQPEALGADGSAEWFYTRHPSRPVQMKHFERVSFQSGSIPPPGTLIVFGPSSSNRHGHIGICLEADENTICLFDQDGIANSAAILAGRPQTGAGQSSWTYDRVLGWLQVREAA